MSFMYQQILCSLIEKIANGVVNKAEIDRSVLASLEQKTLSLELRELGFPICCSVNEQRFVITGVVERSDCTISTDIKSLKLLQKEQQLTELIRQEQLDIKGDIKVAQQFAQLAESFNFDWGKELSNHIGDVPAYKVEQLQIWLKSKFSFAQQQIKSDASEWLVHEKNLLVTLPELTVFSEQVQAVKADLADLEQRIATLLADHQADEDIK